MAVKFGFLLRNETFTVDIPAHVDRRFELASAVGPHAGAGLTIQCAPRARTDLRSFGWIRSNDFELPPGVVTYRAPDNPVVVMPAWTLGNYVLWMQLRTASPDQIPTTLALHIANIDPWLDTYDVPRIRLGRGLTPANPWSGALNRDHVIFPVDAEGRVVVLRYDGGLGSDHTSADGDWVRVSVTTSLGVTVLCDGPHAQRQDLQQEARTMAESLAIHR